MYAALSTSLIKKQDSQNVRQAYIFIFKNRINVLITNNLSRRGFDPRKLLAPGAEAIKDMVITKIKLFGSEGKADE